MPGGGRLCGLLFDSIMGTKFTNQNTNNYENNKRESEILPEFGQPMFVQLVLSGF